MSFASGGSGVVPYSGSSQGSTEGQISTAVAKGFAPSATATATLQFIWPKAEVYLSTVKVH